MRLTKTKKKNDVNYMLEMIWIILPEIIHLLKLIFFGYFPLRYENMLKCSMTIHFPLLLAILDL